MGKVLSGWIQEHESALNHEVTKDTKEEGCFYICWVVACDDAFVKVLADSIHCYIRFPQILYSTGISPDKGRKLIRVDTEGKEQNYQPKTDLLNRFGVFRRILAAPPGVLLAQKMLAVLYRKREMGKDVFDVTFLLGLTGPTSGISIGVQT